MANQITPQALLTIQLRDWTVLLAQLEQNPDTSATEIEYCKAQIDHLQGELDSFDK